MCCGRISARTILPGRSMNMRPGSGALVRALPDMSVSTVSGRWSDFGIRLLSTAILGPVVLLCVWSGGIAWTVLVELGLLGLGVEWARLVKGDRVLPMLLPLALVLCGAVATVA